MSERAFRVLLTYSLVHGVRRAWRDWQWWRKASSVARFNHVLKETWTNSKLVDQLYAQSPLFEWFSEYKA